MGNDLSFRRLVNRLKRELFPLLERKVYNENIRSVVLKKDGKPIMYLVYDKDEKIPLWYLQRQGEIEGCENLLEMEHLPNEEVKITSNFWTCACDHYFIHHKVQMKCPICKLSVPDDTKALNVLKGT